MVHLLVPALFAVASAFVPTDALSASSLSRDYASSARAAAIAKMASQIANTNRFFTINGTDYPVYYGPLAVPGSLTEQIQLEELKKFNALDPKTPQILASFTTNMSSTLTSIKAYDDFYTQASRWVEKPMSFDISDETFGAQRASIKSFALRLATPQDLKQAELALKDSDLQAICGRKGHGLFDQNALFVDDFHDIGKYNDPYRPDKYVPNVVGFFCYNTKKDQLLPIEIRLLDTKLTYTPKDSVLDWTLAKMALETASANYHQWQHMAETHAIVVPLRVEAMRTMSAEHPVNALIQRHVSIDFGLEKLASKNLLNTSTLLDQISGWGATGSARFLWDQTQKGLSFQRQTFYNDMVHRGIHHIKNHKYLAYAWLYNDAFTKFVDDYLSVYYKDDGAVVSDVELQNWANASSHIPHIRDFPTEFDTVDQLRDVLSHMIFISSVRHHGMNGQASWLGSSAPFAPGAFWKPLPTTKLNSPKQDDILAYTTPVKVLPAAMAITVTFYRKVPPSESFYSAYKVKPFSDEKKLQPVIKHLNKALNHIEEKIKTSEADAKWPYLVLLPSQVPFYTWI